MSQPAKPLVETWHQFYDNPGDNIVLITKDNIKFRVASQLLDKHSTLAKPVVGPVLVGNDKIIEVNPFFTALKLIRIDATCRTLELFLSILSPITRGHMIGAVTYRQCRDLLSFTEKYECKDLIPFIRVELIAKTTGRGIPTDLFIFASDRDDWSLGRTAMMRMDAEEVKPLFGIQRGYNSHGPGDEAKANAFFERIRPEWQQKLERILFYGILRTHNTQFSSMDWKSCADQFVKPGKLPKRKASGPATTSATKKVRGG